MICARFCIAIAFSLMASYSWKMPLLLVREIRNLVREKSVKSQGISLSLMCGNPVFKYCRADGTAIWMWDLTQTSY